MRLIVTLLLLSCCAGYCTAQQSPDCQVKKITLYTGILKRGANPAYKPSGDTIVFQKNVLNLSSFVLSSEVYVSDTALNMARCLTCDTNLLPQAIRHDKHKGNAEYHPGGNYIVFTSENEHGAHQPWTVAGAGVNHDIFVTDATGSQFWRLTASAPGGAILHPAFSHDGTKLFWGEMYYSTLFPPQGQEYGLWNLKMADFSAASGTPQLSGIVTFAPRDSVWYESHSFSPDNRFIAFTSHAEDSTAYLGDITIMDTADIGTGNYTNLTSSPNIHDEHAHWSPDGQKISWMSGPFVGGLATYQSELHLMDANGGNPVQLSHFTNPAWPEYVQDTVVTPDHYWSPDGKRIYGFVHFINGSGWQTELYQLEFMGPCGLNPATVKPETAASFSLSVSPNPADRQVLLTAGIFADDEIPVTLYNVLGERVLQQSIHAANGSVTLNTAALAPGMYVVRVAAGTSGFASVKLLIARP